MNRAIERVRAQIEKARKWSARERLNRLLAIGGALLLMLSSIHIMMAAMAAVFSAIYWLLTSSIGQAMIGIALLCPLMIEWRKKRAQKPEVQQRKFERRKKRDSRRIARVAALGSYLRTKEDEWREKFARFYWSATPADQQRKNQKLNFRFTIRDFMKIIKILVSSRS